MLEGLAALARERPAKPVEWLANYLEEHNMEHAGGQPGQADGGQGGEVLGQMNQYMDGGQN